SWGTVIVSPKSTHNAPVLFPTGTGTGTLLTIGICAVLLILVENHSIHHYIVACANVVNSNRDTDFHSRSYGIFIEHFTAPRHIGDRLTEMVSARSAGFLKYDYAARGVLRDRAAAFRCGCGGRRLRNLRPCEGCSDCQGHTE